MKLGNRFKKIITVILTIAVVLSGISAYGYKLSNSGDTGTLKIYCQTLSGKPEFQMQKLINLYKAKYPAVKIKIIPFNIGTMDSRGACSYGNLIDNYNKKLLTDTLSGNGPDVILIDTAQVSAIKLQKAGALEDLNPYIKNDKDFDNLGCNKQVMQGGIYNGKLTLMPMDYRIKLYTTTAEILRKYKIKLSDKITQNQLFSISKPYLKALGPDTKRTFFASLMDIGEFIASSGLNFVDYTNGKSYFTKPEFKNIIDNYKAMYAHVPRNVESVSGEEGTDGLKNNTTLFSADDYYSPEDFLCSESVIRGVTGQTPIINAFPTYNVSDKPVPIIYQCMGITKGAKNKQGAYNFIKTALEAEQRGDDRLFLFTNICNKSIAIAKQQFYKNDLGKKQNVSRRKTVLISKPSPKLLKLYDDMPSNIGKGVIVDCELNKMLFDGIKPYLDGKASYDSVIKALSNKMNIYLNE